MRKQRDYKKQRRNTFGNAPHAARNLIPLGKKRQNQKERRAVKATLVHDPDQAAEVASRASIRDPFRKRPDEPLGRVLMRRYISYFIRGLLRESTFRLRIQALRESYPDFHSEYREHYARLSYLQLPARLVRVLAEYA